MMDDSKALFDYWHDRVYLSNQTLIAAPEHVPTQVLRHNCTNYDNLWRSSEVQALEEPERSKVIAIIKYECTAQVLQQRAGRLKDRASQLENAYADLGKQRSRLLGLINALQKKLFGKDQEVKQLESRIAALAAQNEALRAELDNNKAHAELLTEFEQLKRQYEKVEKRRQELAKNNQSLGGRVSHTERYKRQRDEAMTAVKELKQQMQVLTQENQQLRAENQSLRSTIETYQKRDKLGIVEIKKRHET
jgi:predicted  nucleic acid-binding Zn-ribbon protein